MCSIRRHGRDDVCPTTRGGARRARRKGGVGRGRATQGACARGLTARQPSGSREIFPRCVRLDERGEQRSGRPIPACQRLLARYRRRPNEGRAGLAVRRGHHPGRVRTAWAERRAAGRRRAEGGACPPRAAHSRAPRAGRADHRRRPARAVRRAPRGAAAAGPYRHAPARRPRHHTPAGGRPRRVPAAAPRPAPAPGYPAAATERDGDAWDEGIKEGLTLVTNLVEYKVRDTIQALNELLRLAHEGKLHGLVFIAHRGERRHKMGVTGSYWDDPALALGAAVRMSYRLNQHVTEAEGREPPPHSAHGLLDETPRRR